MRRQNKWKRQSVVTILLIGMNVAVFLILSVFGQTENAQFMLDHGAMYVPYLIERQEYYRLVSAMFLHFGFQHLIGNMLMLGVIGWNLEREIGSIRFLTIYLGSGICGNVVSALAAIRVEEYAVSAGASGAIFGIMGALLYVAIRNRGHVGNISGIQLAVIVAMSLYYGFIGVGVDNLAHIGGIVSGLLLALILYHKRRRKKAIQ